MIESCLSHVQLSSMDQILASIAETVTLLEEYKNFNNVFSAENASHLPLHKDHDHTIDPIDGTQSLHRLIQSLFENALPILQAYIDKNLAKRFIRPSKSPSGAPIFFVPKPNGSLELYVDYRRLNDLAIKNSYLLPLVDEFLDRLGQVNQYTKLDLTDAYYQISIKKEDKWKTAFRIRYSHYNDCVILFDLANALANFQSYINKCLSEKLYIFCNVYFDEFSSTQAKEKLNMKRLPDRYCSN